MVHIAVSMQQRAEQIIGLIELKEQEIFKMYQELGELLIELDHHDIELPEFHGIKMSAPLLNYKDFINKISNRIS